MPPNESQVTYVYLGPDVDDYPTLKAFRECAGRANTIEEFRELIKGTVAKNEPFKVFPENSIRELGGQPQGGRLFEIRQKNS